MIEPTEARRKRQAMAEERQPVAGGRLAVGSSQPPIVSKTNPLRPTTSRLPPFSHCYLSQSCLLGKILGTAERKMLKYKELCLAQRRQDRKGLRACCPLPSASVLSWRSSRLGERIGFGCGRRSLRLRLRCSAGGVIIPPGRMLRKPQGWLRAEDRVNAELQTTEVE